MADLALAGLHPPARHALGDTRHEPWPLAHATVDVLEETLTAAACLDEAPLGGPVVHFSEGVRHQLGLTMPCSWAKAPQATRTGTSG